MKKSILHVMLVLGAAVLVLACGGGKKKVAEGASHYAGPVVEISDSALNANLVDTMDFGRVRRGNKLVKEFMVKNTADKAFVITDVSVGCGCLEVDYPKQPLKPGEEAVVKVMYDVIQYGGMLYKNIVFRTSLSPRPYVVIVLADVEQYTT